MPAHCTFLDEHEVSLEEPAESRVTIIPAPLGNTVSWGKGTEDGPEAILQSSKALEVFDDQLLQETYRAGIATLPPLALTDTTSEKACETIELAVGRVLENGGLPVLLGGEHTVTWPAVAACRHRFPDLHVVQFDAHLDLRDTYENNRYSHACVMRRVWDMGIPFTQVGIRSFSKPEWDFVKAQGLNPFTMEIIRARADWMEKVCDSISGPLYITFDVDGLDPSIMPATGTPEPDGLLWRETVQLIGKLCERHRVVGLDIVELAPVKGLEHATFTAAKLLYRTLGYIFNNLISNN